MLRYDHSSRILEGLFEPIVETDKNGNTVKDTEDELKYRKNSIMFPTPGKGPQMKVNLSRVQPYGTDMSIYSYQASFAYDLYQDGQKYTITYRKVNYRLEPFYNVETKCLYLGNAEVLPAADKDLLWSGYDTSLLFAVKISGLERYGDEIKGYKPQLTFYGVYDSTTSNLAEEIGVLQHPEVKIYIGLFNNNPDAYGTNFVEPSDDNAEWWPEYLRPRLNTKSRFDKNINMLAPAKINADGYAEIATQDMLLFPESVGNPNEDISDAEAGWGHIAGFGLFYDNARYKNVGAETLSFKLSEDKESYSATFSLSEVPLCDQKYILTMKQTTGITPGEETLVKYEGKYVAANNELHIGSHEGLSTPEKKYDGKVENDKIVFTIPKTAFEKHTDGSGKDYASIQIETALEHENLPFLWGDIKGKDEKGNETNGVDLERFQVPVIRKSGLTFTLK